MRPITDTWKPSQIRVRLAETPCCRQQLVLDHCGTPDGAALDPAELALAQRLHLQQCRG